MLDWHRNRNPDGPYRVEVCASPAETGRGWACSPGQVAQLRLEARRVQRAWARAVAEHNRRDDLVRRWSGVADCESGGDWSIDTGNGYYGGLQFTLGTWAAFGGHGQPNLQPAWYQADIADQVRTRSGLHHWPICGTRYRS